MCRHLERLVGRRLIPKLAVHLLQRLSSQAEPCAVAGETQVARPCLHGLRPRVLWAPGPTVPRSSLNNYYAVHRGAVTTSPKQVWNLLKRTRGVTVLIGNKIDERGHQEKVILICLDYPAPGAKGRGRPTGRPKRHGVRRRHRRARRSGDPPPTPTGQGRV